MSDVIVRIPEALIEELRGKVRLESEADIAAFAVDALRVYADLGTLSRGPGTLMWHPEEGTPRRLRLPEGGEPCDKTTEN